MSIKVVSIIPYKILPAKLGGEKGIALFTEYLGKEVPVVSVGTENNDLSKARNFTLLPVLSTSRIRYANAFLYFKLRKIIRDEKATHLLIEHPYYGWLAWMLRNTSPVKWIVHSHNIEFMRSRSIGRWWWKALKWYEVWVYKKSDANFFISDDDREFAQKELNIDPAKSHTITYGVEIGSIPGDIPAATEEIRKKHGIENDESIMLFNGALYLHSNYDAVTVITDHINPILLQSGLQYKILICGKNLPESFNGLKAFAHKNIIYAGFVDDIDVYFKAADIFLNPIVSGGGIKTKAVEAIAMNCTVVSTEFGAMGMKKEICGNKLVTIPGNDWKQFANAVLGSAREKVDTPPEFYEYYYWGNIAKKVKDVLAKTPPTLRFGRGDAQSRNGNP